MSLMGHTDKITSESDPRVLVKAGVRPGLIAKLRNVYPPSVASMALLLRSSTLAEAEGQLPKGEGDITATEEDRTMVALREVFVADALEDARYGPREEVVVVMKYDCVDQRTDIEIGPGTETNGKSPNGGNGKRPQTATMMILRQLLRNDGFRSFFKSRMARSIQGWKGRRMVNQVKEEAAGIAMEITQTAAGAA